MPGSATTRSDITTYRCRIKATRLLLAEFETRLADARDSADHDHIANSQVLLVGTHEDLGNLGLPRELLLEALVHYRTTGNTQDTAEVLSELGDVSRDLGLLAESAQFLRESVRLFQQTDDQQGLRFAFDSLARALEQLGLHTEAGKALARAAALSGG
ncbi:tetratricopeptide repeat protein [Umezawaea sp. Da 62-37]|uniref:tetratricopeptide repeat protein n=1 Tax=Umezawaea sp. Da 62-37 TaxID=3075927 RepID=UPI0028F6EC2C|nr:tetratricopeptide repeat protein [Umezawaea sp. Da 62-37]WNV92194.1 tetratricopeptide repeat protein [Umezawaea sp. Da 62-37]